MMSFAVPEPYGEHFVRADLARTDVARRLPEQAPPPTAADFSAYEQALELAQSSGGAYADALAEPLYGLARLYGEQGRYTQSLALYRRALHIIRVNDGLYSERQIPLVRDLLDSYRLRGEYDELDDRYDYFFRLFGRGQPPYTEVRLRATLEYLRWQREAWALGLDGGNPDRLLQLYTLNEDILQRTAIDPLLSPRWHEEVVRSQVLNLYLIQTEFKPLTVAAAPGTMGLFRAAPMPGEVDLKRQRMDALERSAAGRGKYLLQSLIARADPGDPERVMRLHLALGDWLQWNGQYREALAHYTLAAQKAPSAAHQKPRFFWPREPVELPDNGVFGPPTAVDPKLLLPSVRARFDVSARGRAYNIELLDVSAELAGPASQLKRALGRIRFRPALTDGAARAVTGLERVYTLYD